MYDNKTHDKIKVQKFYACALSSRCNKQFQIIYLARKSDVVADTLSCTYCANLLSLSLYEAHTGLRQPVITQT